MSAAGELLSAAKALVGKGRSVGAAARDADGNAVDPIDESAATFSIHGALTRASWERRDSTGVDTALLLLGASDLGDPKLDGATKRWVDDDDGINKLFDDAIARADGGPTFPVPDNASDWDAKQPKRERADKPSDNPEDDPAR